jgi:hypothetical protein
MMPAASAAFQYRRRAVRTPTADSPTIHHRLVAVGYNNKPLGYLEPRGPMGMDAAVQIQTT